MAPSRGLRVRTQCTTLDQFVSWFKPYYADRSFFLPTSTLRPLGTELAFSLELADGAPVFAGLGGVLKAWSNPANPYGRPGMMIELRRLTPDSAPILERITRAKAAAIDFEVATELAKESYAEQIARSHVPDEPWDLRSAPVEKVDMVDVTGPTPVRPMTGGKQRTGTPTEQLPKPPVVPKVLPADDPDEAAFVDDDQPTTLAHETDDGLAGGEDAYVQMAPIADALDISIPAEAPADAPVPAPPPPAPPVAPVAPDPLPGFASPPVDPALASAVAPIVPRRDWVLTTILVVVLALAASVVVLLVAR